MTQKTEEKQEVPTTYEIPEKEVSNPKTPITIQDAKESGWSDEEIKMGQEEGILAKEEEKKEEPTEEKKEEKPQEENKETQKAKEPKEKEDVDLTPDQEKQLVGLLGKNHNTTGLYFGMKHQRARAQAAEAERDRLMQIVNEKDTQIRSINERIENLEKGITSKEEPQEDEEKPLTRKDLQEMNAKMREDEDQRIKKEREMTNAQAQKMQLALRSQEEHAKAQYPDYNDVVDLGRQLIDRDPKSGKFVNEINIMTLPENVRKKAIFLIRSVESAAIRADTLNTASDMTAADYSYELGQLHPNYGKPKQETSSEKAEPTSNGAKAERTDRGLTPEEVSRIEKNSSRRGSSASISGTGGRRRVSVEDITVDDVNKMDSKTFANFQKNHPEKLEELLRG